MLEPKPAAEVFAAAAAAAADAADASAAAADDDDEGREVRATFRGRAVSCKQVFRSGGNEDTTGWCVWPASAVALRLLARASPALPAPAATDDAAFAKLRLLELSAGAGLVALAAAAAGARVVACETAAQLPLLRANAAAGAGDLRTAQMYWGEEPDESILSAGPFDLILACDLIFIALRDGCQRELAWTLRRLAACAPVALIWEERRIADEDAFVRALALPAANDNGGEYAAALTLEEIVDEHIVSLAKEDRLLGCGGQDEGELTALFYTPPPIRVVILRGAQTVRA